VHFEVVLSVLLLSHISVIRQKKVNYTHISQFGDCIAFDANIVDSQFLFDLFNALSDIICLRRKWKKKEMLEKNCWCGCAKKYEKISDPVWEIDILTSLSLLFLSPLTKSVKFLSNRRCKLPFTCLIFKFNDILNIFLRLVNFIKIFYWNWTGY
jgi:hypothetical protein